MLRGNAFWVRLCSSVYVHPLILAVTCKMISFHPICKRDFANIYIFFLSILHLDVINAFGVIKLLGMGPKAETDAFC